MARLTPLEAEALDVLQMVVDVFTHPVYRNQYKLVMGRVRDILKKLENKKYGCATGRHMGACECKWGKSV